MARLALKRRALQGKENSVPNESAASTKTAAITTEQEAVKPAPVSSTESNEEETPSVSSEPDQRQDEEPPAKAEKSERELALQREKDALRAPFQDLLNGVAK